jgi:hypothetical protein
MSEEKKAHTATRLRGPNIRTVIAAARAEGQMLVSAVAEPNGTIKLAFAESDSGNEPGQAAIQA